MPRTSSSPPVVVVGAGAAGLAAATALVRRGHRPVVLDAGDRVGDSWRNRYERLHLHTTRRFSGLAGRSLPAHLPRYVSKEAYGRYLDEYARALGVDVQLRHPVTRIARDDGAWVVEGQPRPYRAGAVVVATGKHRTPRLPAWPGRDDYRGALVHSAEFRDGSAFAGRRALVVGIGNSGAEIAVDLVEGGAAAVDVSVRTPPPIVRREMFGVPVQLIGMALMPFPARLVDRVGSAARRVAVGDLRPYGLEPAAWGPFVARRPPVIDVGFLGALRRRELTILPAVERLTRDGVVFADGREEAYDVIVAATGFGAGLDGLVPAEALNERGEPRIGAGGASPAAGLYFIGYRESPRGTLFEIRHEAPRLARAVARYITSSR